MRGVSRAFRGSGKHELAESVRARGDHAPVLLAEEEDDKGGHWWAGLATWAAGKRQVIPLSLFSLIVSVFYFL